MGDVERLAEVLAGGEPADWEYALFARRLLRSDWLASHDVEVAADARREALREAADAAVSDSDECVPWTHDHDRAAVACWLHDRADREAASHTPEGGR